MLFVDLQMLFSVLRRLELCVIVRRLPLLLALTIVSISLARVNKPINRKVCMQDMKSFIEEKVSSPVCFPGIIMYTPGNPD